MDYKLDPLVGRDPLPGDEIAFNRVTALFERARNMKVKQPINEINQRWQEVLSVFLDETPSIELINSWRTTDSCDLQDFIGMHLKPSVGWSTAIGVIEAVMTVVYCALENSNLTTEGEIYLNTSGRRVRVVNT